MKRFMRFSASAPWLILSLILAISLILGLQLSNLKIQITADELLVMNDPERDVADRLTEQFGGKRVSLLVIQDEHIFQPGKLKSLAELKQKMLALDEVESINSLFDIPNIKSVDGFLVKDAYLKTLPETAKQADETANQALGNPFISGVLLSVDKKSMAMALIHPDQSARFNEQVFIQRMDDLMASANHEFAKVFVVGYSHVRQEIAEKIRDEQMNLFPVALILLFIILFVLLRQLMDVLMPVLTAGISILWTLGIMAWFGFPLNVVTSIVPILLIIVGASIDIHLLSEFRAAQQEGMNKHDALDSMIQTMGKIVTLTFVTTYIGFLSVGLSKIDVLWQFGLMASTGLLLNFLITLSLIPAVLKLTGHWKMDGAVNLSHWVSREWVNRYWTWLDDNRKGIFYLLSLLSFVSFWGMAQIQVNHNVLDNLNKDSQIRQHFDEVNQQLSGMETFSIVLDSGIEDTFLKVKYLQELAEIQQFLQQQGQVGSSTSFVDYLTQLNTAFSELESPEMPDTDDIVQELMIFLDYEHVKAYVSEDYSSARVLVRHKVNDSKALKQLVDELNMYLFAHVDAGLDVYVTGDSVLTLSATKAMIAGQLKSILVLIVIIILVIALLFFDAKVGLIAVLPNMLPVVVLFGFMGWAEIPLNIGTTMAAAIAIGIAVDDTMHFMLRYNHELKSNRNQVVAIEAALKAEAVPMLATSLALISGFLTFTLSGFEPIAQFGMLSALVIVTALIADFVLTPLLLSSLRLVTLWDMLSLQLRQQIIEKSVIFEGMKPWQIRRFILSSRILRFKDQEPVFNLHEKSENMYLVMSGKVEVFHTSPLNHERVAESFTPGHIFGEVSMFANVTRHNDAVALGDTSLLVLNSDAICHATYLQRATAAKLFLNLTRHVSKRLVKLVYQKESA